MVYAATNGGLSISYDNGGSFINKTTADGLGLNSILSVFVDNKGTLLATTNGGGVSISYDAASSFTTYTTANNLGNNTCLKAFSYGNRYYIATTGGLSIGDKGSSVFSNKTTAHGLGDNSIYDVFVTTSHIYVGTNSGGLAISTDGGNHFTAIHTGNSNLPHDRVFGISSYGDTVFISTQNGLALSSNDTNTFTIKNTLHGLGNNLVRQCFFY